MNEKNIVICDSEIRYADSLAANICERKELAVKVYTCSSLEKACRLSEKKTVHIFIVDESYTKEEREKIAAEQTFVLCKGKAGDLREEEISVYKYQNADNIIRIIFAAYLEKTGGNVMRNMYKERTRLVAVYSPIHRIGKTTFAMELGKKWAKRERVLYLNLEEYAGFAGAEEGELNLGDLLYYVKQGNGNPAVHLQSAVRTTEGLDYILPIPMVLDLKEVTGQEWQDLLEQIMQNSNYETIILDMSESVQGLFQILERCERIYMPVKEDEISAQKVNKYRETIEKLGKTKLWENTYQFVMQKDVEEYVKVRMKEE